MFLLSRHVVRTILDLKRSFWKFYPRSRSSPDRKSSYYISIDSLRQSEHIQCVFITLSRLYEKLLPKDCWWPFMTWNDLGDTRRGLWPQFSHSGCQCYLQTNDWECLEWLSSKRGASQFFSPWFIIERSQSWPDFGSPISKFRGRYTYILYDAVTHIQ